MKTIVKAIYENGVFRPLTPPEISEGQELTIIVETPRVLTPEEMLELAAQVYQRLEEDKIDEIEKIALRGDFFGEPTA